MNNKYLVGIMVLIIGLYGGFKMYASNLAKKKVDAAISEHIPKADIEYGDISVDLIGLGVHINDIVITNSKRGNEKVEIDELFLADLDEESEFPEYVDISLNGIHMEQILKLQDKMSENDWKIVFGVENSSDPILINVSTSYNFNDNKEAEFEMSFGGDNVGTLALKLELGGVNKPTKIEKIGNAITDAETASLMGLSLSYEDDSMMIRLIESLSKKDDLSISDFKDKLKVELRENAAKQGEIAKKNARKLEEFIDDPDAISITAKPEEPLVLMKAWMSVIGGKESIDDVLKKLNFDLHV
jgi:hypothetical protein